jgi:diguanylate cyclase (GGDEF)-like protein
MSKGRIDEQMDTLRSRWQDYRDEGAFEQFVEFTLALNSLAERMARLRLPGLVRQCEGLENAALALFGNTDTHPVATQTIVALDRQLASLLGAIASARRIDREPDQRTHDTPEPLPAEWIKPRTIWMFSAPTAAWSAGLAAQLTFYGFTVRVMRWFSELPKEDPPFAVIFVPEDDMATENAEAMADIRRVRTACSASQLYFVGVPPTLDQMVDLMRVGIDITVQRDDQMADLMSSVLDLVQTQQDTERYRILVVEDSRVALTQIQRALKQHGIDCDAIPDPSRLFEVIADYRPDLILMDMYMPGCNGVEATRALRQLTAYQAVPIVYLSAETEVGLQVEALRLGGDQFLTKPFNPVLLAATVKTTIERHREMRRAARHDGLTGLLNHTASKAELDSLLMALPPDGRLAVAMIDIDHFKSVNDGYGHPVGDQVIRSMAWLLKGWLRGTDMIGRYGGEEFIIAMPGIGTHEARSVLDGIRAHFANLPHAHATGNLRVTFSAGVADFPRFDSPSDLIEAADQALLQAKALGRNQIVEAIAPELLPD